MKRLCLLLLLSVTGLISYANHITGGEMYYTLTSRSGNDYTYHVVLKLYRDCNSSGAQLDNLAPISIFNKSTNVSVWAKEVPKGPTVVLSIGSPDPCINNPPVVCYEVGYYEFDVTLPGTAAGYTISYQRCCRIAGINNLIGSNNVGATYTAEIPGTAITSTGPTNNSARFIGADTVVVCSNNSFCYNFGATDADTDSLAYFFCSAYTGGTAGNPAPNPPAAPPYANVPYNFGSGFDATSPMGPGVTLDPKTGMMCGIAPAPGIYVVTVCVAEYRNGEPIAIQRKDLQIKVGDCDLVKASLPTSFPICDGFTRTFENLTPPNALIRSYAWDFGDGNTSTQPTPTHTYADTGTYQVTLVVNRGEACSDSATALAHVYPGFFPGFTFAGICVNKPTQFFDSTVTAYGTVNSWRWDFGNSGAGDDTSQLQNPIFTYGSLGDRNVRLIVTSSKGCVDTVFKTVEILDKPPVQGVPSDTLICVGDNVQLGAVGNGNFSWTGPAIISGGNTATPVVSPASTSNYIVQLEDNGCINTDTVQVKVISFVTVQEMPDTVICLTDSLQLKINSDGLHFNWTPAEDLNDPTLKNPWARPTGNTTYQVTATVGGCSTTENITVATVPYPVANAGPDTTICFASQAQLHASIVGNAFTWSPAASLDDPAVLNPVASPFATTSYILTVTDIQGCPKPKRDTIIVSVLPRVNAFAGNDTAVVIGQPLQLNAEGGISYQWVPSIGLSSSVVADPVGVYDGSFDSVRYQVLVRDEAGCTDSAFITVKIFNTNPQIFVPTVFTPNGDGKNDVFRPVAVGISEFEYFRVYNRWGQLVHTSTASHAGWDGKIGGKDQPTSTYAWIARGVDYTGKVVFAKGTVTLIR